MESSAPAIADLAGPPPEVVETFQVATRVLVGLALRSMDVLNGAVTLPQFRMLAVLDDLGTARSSRVAAALGLKPSAVTRLAERMVAAGYVIRGSEPANRSVVTLTLTPSGRQIVAKGLDWRRSELRRVLGQLDLPSDQLAAAAKALMALVETVGEGYGTAAQARINPW
jgi:DNA-binding MarR family transcriptional regulator